MLSPAASLRLIRLDWQGYPASASVSVFLTDLLLRCRGVQLIGRSRDIYPVSLITLELITKGEVKMNTAEHLYSYIESLQERDFHISACIKIDESLESDFLVYLAKWFRTPRYKYDTKRLVEEYGLIDRSSCYFGEYGKDGAYIAIDSSMPIYCCQNRDFDALPGDVPGQLCAFKFWKENVLEYNWDSHDYHCFEWLNYLIKHFFEPNGYFLNGGVRYIDAKGHVFCTIHVSDNVVSCSEFVPGKF